MDASHPLMLEGRRVEVDPHGPTASKCQGGRASSSRANRRVRDEDYQTVVGVDTAKRVFQLHPVDVETGEIVNLKLTRAKFLEHFANRTSCVVAMEACGGTQHWARRLQQLGHEPQLLPDKSVRPFVAGNKNDTHDSRAIWTVAQQPGVKTVAVRSKEQQAVLAMHRMRQQRVKFRTARINSLRGPLTEYGEVMPKGRAGTSRAIALALERVSERLPAMIIEMLRELLARVTQLDGEIGEIERRLRLWHRSNASSQPLAEIPGVGVLTATAVVVAMSDPAAFRFGRERSARCLAERLAVGLCTSCGQRPSAADGARCEPCREVRRAFERERYAARRAAGLCGCCRGRRWTAARVADRARCARPSAARPRRRTPPPVGSTRGARRRVFAPIAASPCRGRPGANPVRAGRTSARTTSGGCRSTTRSSPSSTSRRAAGSAPSTPGRTSLWRSPSPG